MTQHNRLCTALRITVLTTKGLVCHSEYQNSQLKTLFVTQGTSTHHYGPCVSLRVSVIIIIGLVCHSGHQYLPLHALYVIPLSDWYVTHSTSTNLYQTGYVTHSTCTNLYQPGMSLIVPVRTSISLVCHS